MVRSLIFCLGLIFSTSWVHADWEASLITVTPGPRTDQWFGHSAMMFRNTDIPDRVVILHYGFANLSALFQDRLGTTVEAFLNDRLEADIYREEDVLDSLSLPRNFWRYYYHGTAGDRQAQNLNRMIYVNHLSVTSPQAEQLKNRMEDEYSRSLVQGTGRHVFVYNNFTANCATKIRDHLDHVLSLHSRPELQSQEPRSRRDIIEESVDEGIRSILPPNRQEVELPLPRDLNSLTRTLGGAGFTNGRSLFEAMLVLDRSMSDPGLSGHFFRMMLSRANLPSDRIPQAFHRYIAGAGLDPASPQAPQTRYASIFTPKMLREALLLIDSQNGREVTETSEHARGRYPSVVPSQTSPTVPASDAGSSSDAAAIVD